MSAHPSLPFTQQQKVIDILNQISIFGALSESDLYEVFRQLKQVSYKAGEIIFEQDSEPDYIYIVLEGAVQISSHGNLSPEQEVEIAYMDVGQCFGEISVIGIQPHTGRAKVLEDSELLVLSSAALFSFHENNPTLFGLLVLNIAREACRRLYKTNEILLQYAASVQHNYTPD